MRDRGNFIAGDWGTSNLRLWLCAGDGRVLDRAQGPGVAAVPGRLEEAFLIASQGWRHTHGPLPALLCGMVGSTIGWQEAAYQPCPADVRTLSAGLTRFHAAGGDVAIVPGLSMPGGPDRSADVMRGEETQILGLLAGSPDLRRGRHLICLPGSHTKWALLDDGRVTAFQTGFSGELFALLRTHSVLGRGMVGLEPRLDAHFQQGLQRAMTGQPLPHLLFQTRAGQMLTGWSAQDALSFLSGLVTGSDVAGGITLADGPVTIVASPALAPFYAAALTHAGRGCTCLDGGDLALAGLLSIAGEALN